MIIKKQDIVILKRLNISSRLLLVVLLSGAFLVGLGIPLILSNLQQQNKQSNTAPTVAPSPVDLALNAKTSTLNVKETIDITLSISAGNQEVDAGDFIVYFDPTVLKATKITNGDFFQTIPVSKIEKNFVKISGTATLKNDTITFPKGTGTIATITFSTLKPAKETLVYFNPDKTIVATDGKNILGNIADLTLSIK